MALLFIPDISGFTAFVNRTDIEHSRHIVSELLELLIEADTLGLTVDEIEGDAILFHREGPPPSVEELTRQAEVMFVRFHEHLRQYEHRRICQCGACQSAQNLSLKIVAHEGPVEFVRVREFTKPYGPDVILVHRLLKNDVPESEYLLATSSATPSGVHPLEWAEWQAGEATYDELDPTPFHYLPLSALHERVAEPPGLTDYPRLERPRSFETVIPLDIERAFDLLTDLSKRLTWTKGLDEFIYEAERVNRVGTRHRCVIDGKPIDFETMSADFGPGARVFGERVDAIPLVRSFVIFWILRPEGSGTRVRTELHYEPRTGLQSLLAPIFPLAFRKPYRHSFESFVRQATALAETPDVTSEATEQPYD